MKKNSIFFTLTIICNLIVSHRSEAQDLSAIKKQIVKDNALYFELFKNHDPSIVELYTGDGKLMPPNTVVISGRAELIKDFKGTYADGKIKGVQFSTTNVYGDGIVYVTEEGTYHTYGTNNQVIEKGNYLKLWKKTNRGWKIFRDLFNSDQKGS